VTRPSPIPSRRWSALALAVLTLALASLAPAPAHAASFGSGCTIEALGPAPVAINDYGRKVTHGRATVTCPIAGNVEVEYAMYGSDPLSDDLVQRIRKEPIQLLARQPYTVPRRSMTDPNDNYVDYQPSCNEDSPGKDELYVKARARVVTNGVPSAWSKWDKGQTLTYDCG
jgi:hypothetical protein